MQLIPKYQEYNTQTLHSLTTIINNTNECQLKIEVIWH